MIHSGENKIEIGYYKNSASQIIIKIFTIDYSRQLQ